MAVKVQVGMDEVVRHFEALEDPRSSINQLPPLPSVVVISVMAVLAGAGGPTAIAKWPNLKAEYLLKLLPLPNGIPQKDFYWRVLSAWTRPAFKYDAHQDETGISPPYLCGVNLVLMDPIEFASTATTVRPMLVHPSIRSGHTTCVACKIQVC